MSETPCETCWKFYECEKSETRDVDIECDGWEQ